MSFTKDDTNKVKGLAIILLLFHHCFVSPGRYASYTVLFPILPEHMITRLATMARVCVAIFTFLSAYGMTLSYKKRFQTKKSKGRVILREYRHRMAALIGNFSFIYMFVVLWGTLVMKDGRIQNYGNGIRKAGYLVIDALGLAGIAHTPTYLFTWWYESLAIVIVLILPLLIGLYRGLGVWGLFPISLLFAVAVPVDNTSPYEYLQISNYLFCICLGIAAAEKNWIAKIGNAGRYAGLKFLKMILELIGIGLLLYLNLRIYGSMLQPLTEGLSAFFIVCFCYEFLGKIPIIGRILRYLGVYSGSIYLIHNMLRSSWCPKFIYGFRYPALITAVLLVCSLCLSVLIEKSEHLLHYDRLLQRLG